MWDIAFSFASAGVRYLSGTVDGTPARSNSNEANIPQWNPEGPSILTTLWLLTVLPHGTKLAFEKHGASHDLPDTGWMPIQYAKRRWNRDGLVKLKDLILAIQTAVQICPPQRIPKTDYELMIAKSDYSNQPSINKHYLGAREGLFALANTYGYKIDLTEFRKKQVQDSMYLQPKKVKIKKDMDYAARKAITRSIQRIDRAMTEKLPAAQLGELSQRVQENWKPGNFDSIALYMEEAKKKVKKDQNSKECPCNNELQIIYAMINTKIEEFEGFTKDCSKHKFVRSVSEPQPRHDIPAAAAPLPQKLSLSNPKNIVDFPPAVPSAAATPEPVSALPDSAAHPESPPLSMFKQDDDDN